MTPQPLIILDLDNTIFETRSMGEKMLDGLFSGFKNAAKSFYSDRQIDQMVEDLWSHPLDDVAKKYHFPNLLYSMIDDAIHQLDLDLEIKTFEDYPLLRRIDGDKILVTTGFPHLQMAKIQALDIIDDFVEIRIDNIADPERKFKMGIFRDILESEKYSRVSTWVIGDNPHSELEAAHHLGIPAIQMAKLGQPSSNLADHTVSTYQEVLEIIHGH